MSEAERWLDLISAVARAFVDVVVGAEDSRPKQAEGTVLTLINVVDLKVKVDAECTSCVELLVDVGTVKEELEDQCSPTDVSCFKGLPGAQLISAVQSGPCGGLCSGSIYDVKQSNTVVLAARAKIRKVTPEQNEAMHEQVLATLGGDFAPSKSEVAAIAAGKTLAEWEEEESTGEVAVSGATETPVTQAISQLVFAATELKVEGGGAEVVAISSTVAVDAVMKAISTTSVDLVKKVAGDAVTLARQRVDRKITVTIQERFAESVEYFIICGVVLVVLLVLMGALLLVRALSKK